MNELLSNLTKPNVSQKEIMHTTFDLQLIVTREIAKTDSNLNEIANLIFDLLNRTDQINEYALFPFLSIVPQIFYKLDSDKQTFLQKLIEIDVPIHILIPLFRSLSEINLNNASTESYFNKLSQVIENNPKSASSLLNIILFFYEYKKLPKCADLICKIFQYLDSNELPDCFYLIRQRRSHSFDLVSAITRHISSYVNKKDAKFNNSDLLLLFIISKIDIGQPSALIRKLITKDEKFHLSLEKFNMKVFSPSDLIDCFCGICSDNLKKQYITIVARLLYQCFVSTEYREIITYALYNEDENRNLFDATIEAFELCSKNSKKLILDKIDVISILYSVSKNVCALIIGSILRVAAYSPITIDSAIIYLKKLLMRPVHAEKAIKCFCLLYESIEGPQNAQFRLQIIDILFQIFDEPYFRFKICKELRKIDINHFDNEIKQKILKYCEKFENNIHELNSLVSLDQNQCIIINDTPAALLDLLIYLGKDPKEYFHLIELKDRIFEDDQLETIKFALIVDIFAVLAPFNEDFFKIFCEFSISLTKKTLCNQDIIKEWCTLSLNRDFAEKQLIKAEKVSFINNIFLIESLTDHQISNECYNALSQLFISDDLKNEEFSILTKELAKYGVFDPSEYHAIYKELILGILLESDASFKLDSNQIINQLISSLETGDLSTEALLSYVSLLSTQIPSGDLEISARLYDLIKKLEFNNTKVVSKFIELLLLKSPRDMAIQYSYEILNSWEDKGEFIVNKQKSKKSAMYVSMCKCLAARAIAEQKISDDLLDLLCEVLEPSNIISTAFVLNATLELILNFIKLLENPPPQNFEKFRNLVYSFLSRFRSEKGSKLSGYIESLLTVYVSNLNQGKLPKERKKNQTMNPYSKQRWRSRNKWIDQALREQSSSDEDNYADLEGFIVESEDENSKEEKTSENEEFEPNKEEEEELDEETQKKLYEEAMKRVLRYKPKFGNMFDRVV
ncbi:hypothetical protein TVAG_063240 [Trichomonas vaginalis G3]|uniref:Uncharacterized protein n=1 Tax=Trichomonas vaginalis (strain ATCC PRA-98 / G3) TaxID=412133 RepID=A2DLT6_TRIV3|nr:hypothetical protein TVAGG3_0581610 [Trichomonas vaginalis G3]EAY18719.1 hypothetical protein TVAG_063240 [Trichomonas vaginalis G3]KAI5522623.1 hypothetical protein TVAGG3_0581610 [Trichomonas vaginalis G3]|eukprot:XP_001579705.1 hypothetical protein [Trichomonas vaginalis G3]